MKKIFSWGLTVVLVLAFLIIPQEQGKAKSLQFQDLQDSSSGYGYAFNFVSYLTTHNDVIHGYTINDKSYFKPGNPITRQQAAIMLVKALGEGPSKTTKPYFKDVGPTDSAFGYIQKAKELGIFSGHADGTFGPNEQLNRLQMAYAITNTFHLKQLPNQPSGFSDMSPSDPGYGRVNALYFDGFSHGSNGDYKPSSNITRAAFSVFVARGMDSSLRLQPQLADGVVNVDTSSYLNVHSSPRISALHIGELNKGQQVAIYGETDSWYKILYNGAWGYVSKSFIDNLANASPATNGTCSDGSTSHVASANSMCSPATTPTSMNTGTVPTSPSQTKGTTDSAGSTGTTAASGTTTSPSSGTDSGTTATTTSPSSGTDSGTTATTTSPGSGTNSGTTATTTSPGNGTDSGTTATTTSPGSGTNSGTTGTTDPSNGTAPIDMSKPLTNKVVVIDPGHGGIDPGTSSNGIDEKTVTLQVGMELKPMLEALGAKVYMTRTADTSVSLAARTELADQVHADLFLSIHCNSANPLVYGAETYYNTQNNPYPGDSQALASDIENGIADSTHTFERGAYNDTRLYDIGLYVLRENKHPAALTELGFLSNPTDRLMLTTPQIQMLYASGIKQGIVKYFNTHPNP